MARESRFVSLVIPAHNEMGNISTICRVIADVMQDRHYEIIIVNDGSRDETLTEIKRCHAQDPHVQFISLSRNFGHQMAVKAGLEHARGDCVITLDADQEHPVALLPRMLQLWEQGYDIVQTCRQKNKSLPFYKRFFSGLFYKCASVLSDIEIKPGAADFRLLDRRVVDICAQLSESDIFWRGIVPWLGFKQTFLDYKQGTRTVGESKYTFKKMLTLSLSGVTGFSTKPLQLSTSLGVLLASFSFFYLMYALFIRLFTGQTVEGWTSVIASVLLIGGIQLVMLGILGLYLGKVFVEIKRRPPYIIDEISPALSSVSRTNRDPT